MFTSVVKEKMESNSDKEEVFLNFLKLRRKDNNGSEAFPKIEKQKGITTH